MSDNTKIEWTDATANYVNGCSVVSPGCTNCYAMRLAGTRLRDHPTRAGLTQPSKAGPVWTGEVRRNERVLQDVLGWKKPRRIFWNAHGDLFHPAVPIEWIDAQFAAMGATPHHTHQVLTKRPDRARQYISQLPERVFTEFGGWEAFGDYHFNGIYHRTIETWPLPNLWLGTSVEDQTRADERIPHLLATPAAVRFISAEPLLGPVDVTAIEMPNGVGVDVFDALQFDHEHGEPDTEQGTATLDWVIVGGESGPGARPMHPGWARSLRDQCAAAGVPFHFKQWGEWVPTLGAVDAWDIGDDPEQSRFDHRDWEDGKWGADYRPCWCDETADDTVLRVGKARAGRLLDGNLHDGFPA